MAPPDDARGTGASQAAPEVSGFPPVFPPG